MIVREEYRVLRPQPGPQTEFLTCPADIIIFGGAAGGGKTYAITLDPARFIDVPHFGAVTFRRESGQIANEGGPWDTATEIYEPLGFKAVTSPKHTLKDSKRKVKLTYSHMQLEKHMRQWDGAQIPGIYFDELQHFSEKQFWYMLSRNRSTCGVRPYIKATCNPDPDSFLVDLLSWWIFQTEEEIPEELKAEGYIPGDPNPYRSGVIRWFIRDAGVVYWGDSKEELVEKFGAKKGNSAKSFTFIRSKLEDNKALMEADPDYEANLDAMLDYERQRLKRGNWFARPTAGELFKRHYFEILDTYDMSLAQRMIRYWDRAATVPSEENSDPDWTAGVLMAEDVSGDFIILDIARERFEPADVEALIDQCVIMDGEDTVLGLEQEPGASGKMEVNYYVRKYSHLDVQVFPKTKSKLTCWKPFARAVKNGRVKILRAAWNRAFLSEAESVTDGTQAGHDDQIDGASGAYSYLTSDDFGMGAVARGVL